MKLLNLTVRNIKGELATGCYSHTKNKVKFYVVVWNNTQFFGTDLETIFNTL
jgi:hypothetical protein